MSLRQVLQELTAKRLSGDKTFYGRISTIKEVGSRPDVIAHIYKFFAVGGSKIIDGEIFYYSKLGKYFLLVDRTPVYIKGIERFITGFAVNANVLANVQTLTTGTPDGFGYSVKTWTDKLTSYVNFFSGYLSMNQLPVAALPSGAYEVTVSRSTEIIYKIKVGDRIIMNGTNYKVDLVDDTRYTNNAYSCRVVEDDRK